MKKNIVYVTGIISIKFRLPKSICVLYPIHVIAFLDFLLLVFLMKNAFR